MSHRPIVIQSYAKYGLTMSKDKNCGPNTKSCQKSYKLLLRSKSMSYRPMSNDMPMSKQTYITGRTGRHIKTPVILTLRQKSNVVSGSWTFATYHLMVVHPSAKCGKPMSKQKNVTDRTRIYTDRWADRRRDRRRDRQSDSYLAP